MVEVKVYDETGAVVQTLAWKRSSREVCYRFSSRKVAKASFKELARILGVQGDTWYKTGI